MNSLDEYRIRQGLDIFIVPDFAQNILKCDPRQIQHELETSYPVRGVRIVISFLRMSSSAISMKTPKRCQSA